MMQSLAAPPHYTVGDLAYELEGLGVSPDGFERVLALAHSLTPWNGATALTDVADHYRIGVFLTAEVSRFSGRAVGHYLECTVLVWPKTQSDYRLEGRRLPPWL